MEDLKFFENFFYTFFTFSRLMLSAHPFSPFFFSVTLVLLP